MLLYLPLLIPSLCFCGGLTSIEIFDVFDDMDLEMPVMDTVARSAGEYKTTIDPYKLNGNITIRSVNNTHNISNKEIDNHGGDQHKLSYPDQLNGNITITSANNTHNISIKEIDKNGGDEHKLSYPDQLNGNITITSANNTHNISIKENGGDQRKLNNSIVEAADPTSMLNESASTAFTIPPVPFSCPEEEPPSNIGPYEVPTQRDVVLHIRNHLLAMYHGFHAKAMHFLTDVKEATQASWSRKMFCRGPTELMHYRRCVRWVGDQSVLTTKSLVTALETARHHISTLIQGKICNISAMSLDPIHLIRILAAEKVSLEFALPDFLRQLDACARHCPSTRSKLSQDYLKTAHLTNKDFVIRHYLTQQNYNQQLKQKYTI